MASQPPTGYNPEVSLLQGGTASIQPVQGGGGMDGGATTPPPGFNPTTSLLQGGTAPIVPIRGGGGQEGGVAFQNAPNVRTYDPNAPPENVGKAPPKAPPAATDAAATDAAPPKAPPAATDAKAKPKAENSKVPFAGYVVESYTLKEEVVTLPKFEDLVFKNQVASYVDATSTVLFQTPTTKKLMNGTEVSTPNLDRCAETTRNTNYFKLIPQRLTLLEDDTPYIWVFPNIEGNVGKFMNAMKLVPRDKSDEIAPHHYVLFTGQFFAAPGNPDNRILFQEFLRHKMKVPGVSSSKLFLLQNFNENLLKVACDLTEVGYAVSPVKKQQMLLLCREPSVIVFTKQQIVFRNQPLPVGIDNESVKLSVFLKDKTFKSALLEGRDSFYISPRLGGFDFLPDAADDTNPYFTVNFQEDAALYKPVQADIVCPKSVKDGCGGFQAAYKVPELGDSRKLPPPALYILYKNTTGFPFRAPKDAVRNAPAAKDLSGAKPKTATDISGTKDLSGVPQKKVLKGILKPGGPVAAERPKSAFTASKSAMQASEETIVLNLKNYRLRSAEPEVMKNWEDLIFTEGEVEFLEDLQFTPDILQKAVHDGEWKVALAEFLEAIVDSNCFQDTTLLINAQCSKAEKLIQEVYFEMYNRALESLYDAKRGFQASAIADVYSLLKQLAVLTKGLAIEEISPADFTGDLLGRKYQVQYNPKQKRFYTNVAELSNAQVRSLQDLKFKRMISPDISALLAAFEATKPSGAAAVAEDTGKPPAAAAEGTGKPPAAAEDTGKPPAAAAEDTGKPPAAAAEGTGKPPAAVAEEAASPSPVDLGAPGSEKAIGGSSHHTRGRRKVRKWKTRKGKKSSK